MRRLTILFLTLVFVSLPMLALAQPVDGTYTSAFRGGNVLNGHTSVARQGVNSGNPKIFHGQSWDGVALGTQWEIKCGVQTTDTPPDYSLYNALTGNGFITYNQTFNGGTFTLYADPNVGWGSGSGTLNVTQATSQVFYQNFIPVSSSFTAFTSGMFDGGQCRLDFAFGNGFGVGETPYLVKPATYPAFLAADCSLADGAHQFGVWADANDIIVQIACPVPVEESTWGAVKALYR
ncbi:MAG TPA: hypothetical protein VFX92_04730 [Candidatus Krumholzibacteria bacterium]|nr:hypothetical protein [Candidatus Krumholzibacteria bacterium]